MSALLFLNCNHMMLSSYYDASIRAVEAAVESHPDYTSVDTSPFARCCRIRIISDEPLAKQNIGVGLGSVSKSLNVVSALVTLPGSAFDPFSPLKHKNIHIAFLTVNRIAVNIADASHRTDAVC